MIYLDSNAQLCAYDFSKPEKEPIVLYDEILDKKNPYIVKLDSNKEHLVLLANVFDERKISCDRHYRFAVFNVHNLNERLPIASGIFDIREFPDDFNLKWNGKRLEIHGKYESDEKKWNNGKPIVIEFAKNGNWVYFNEAEESVFG
ncbi:MAG: hypothetical protein ABIB11_03680, partial [Candidatus Omnitrophota bacterium]